MGAPDRAPQRPNVGGEALATVGEVAAFLRVPPRTLYRWRYVGVGPPAFRVGKHLRFRWGDVETWLLERGDPAARQRARGAKTGHRTGVGSRARKTDQRADGS
jgi:excisionase family DNA binding protein